MRPVEWRTSILVRTFLHAQGHEARRRFASRGFWMVGYEGEISSGWWLQPIGKIMEFVSWNDYSQLIWKAIQNSMVPNHQPVLFPMKSADQFLCKPLLKCPLECSRSESVDQRSTSQCPEMSGLSQNSVSPMPSPLFIPMIPMILCSLC